MGASDTVALNRFVSTDASVAATTGLANTLVNPVIQSVTAIPDTEPEKGTTTYPAGTHVQASVAVTWTIPGTAPPQTGAAATGTVDQRAQTVSNYRVTLNLTTQGWFVQDFHAGKAAAGNFPATSAATTTSQATPEPARYQLTADPRHTGMPHPGLRCNTTRQVHEALGESSQASGRHYLSHTSINAGDAAEHRRPILPGFRSTGHPILLS